MKPYLFGIFCCCLALLACREQAIEDVEAPQITIQSPTAQTIFESGEDIPLAILIEENDQLHEYQVVVLTEEGQTPVFNVSDHSHLQRLEINQSFSLTVMEETSLILEVEASDHHGNQNVASTRFQLIP
ncbi:MAG: hypothetical protein AAF399_17825 [Bacteroidota bacterium]